MRVSNIAIVELPGACQVQARVLSERQEDHDEWFPPFDLWFRFPAWCRSYMTLENGDPFVAALLVAAMRTSERLVVAATVSPRLMAALSDIQAIYAAFDKRAHRITVEAPSAPNLCRSATSRNRPGSFFPWVSTRSTVC